MHFWKWLAEKGTGKGKNFFAGSPTPKKIQLVRQKIREL